MGLILVTGATGFIGQHLCPLLTQRGHNVRGTLRKRVAPSEFPTCMQWVEIGDIGPSTEWSLALEDVDCVIHLAGLAHRPGTNGEKQAAEFMRVNAEGTRRLAEAVSKSPSVSRLVFVSSVGAVKSISDVVITDSTPCEPDSAYGRSKRAAELALEEVLQNSKVDWCVIRPTLVYGPGNPGNMARLLKGVSAGIPLPLSAIRNRRSFVFVKNLVDALERCAFHPGASRRVFMISDGEVVSTPQFLRELSRHCGKRILLFPVPRRVLKGLGKMGDVISRLLGRPVGFDSYSVNRVIGSLVVDISSLQQAIAWQPSFTMDQGLASSFSNHGEAQIPLPV